ncbi:restriction endonuclease subunit S [Spirosoma pulveris]
MTANQLSVFPPEQTLTASTIHQTTSGNQPNLPNGWQWVKLSDVGKAVTGTTPSKANKGFYGKVFPFFKPTDLAQGINTISASDNLSEEGMTVARFLPAGSILVTCIGATIGKTGLISVPGTCNQQINALIPSQNLISKYGYYYCLSKRFQRELKDNASSTTLPILNKSKFERLTFPLPPLAEQQRIVAKIEELFSEIDAGIQEVETALQRLKTYRQAVLNEFIDDDSLNTVRLGDIATIRGGVTKGRNLDGLPTISLPYLRVANVQDGFLNLREIKYIDVLETDLEKYRLVENDILFTEGGDKDKLGRGTIWRDEIANCIHQNHIFRARVDQHAVNPIYVTYASKTTKAKRYFYKVAKQTTNLASINMSQLCNLEIPLPDLDTQTRIVQEIEARLSEADALEKTLRTELLRAERLRQSVLKQAFTGKLLKTDVPASLPA